MRKPQCTRVHEDFRIKYNAESTLLTHPLAANIFNILLNTDENQHRISQSEAYDTDQNAYLRHILRRDQSC